MRRDSNSTLQCTEMRVGKIEYLNVLPFFHNLKDYFSKDLENIKIDYLDAYPSKLNQALHEKKLDLAPISSLEYLNHHQDYILLPNLTIGARDFSGSVLLFSKEKIEGLNGVSIALTNQSLSSATLLKIILKFKLKFTNRFIPSSASADEMIAKYEAALMIGDDALFYKPKEFVYKYDLSELWWNWTGKPFCFSVWAVRREFAQKYPDEVAAFYHAVLKARDRNLGDIELLIKQAAGVSFMDEKFSKIFGYLFNLNYQLDREMIEGLQLFYRFANRLGASPRIEKLEFFEEV